MHRTLCVLAALVALASAASVTVTINVVYPEENIPDGGSIVLRGSACGLSWYDDTPTTMGSDNTFTASVSCPTGTDLQFKSRVTGFTSWTSSYYSYEEAPNTDKSSSSSNAAVWQIGYNEEVDVGTTDVSVTSYPFFFTYQGTYAHYDDIISPQLNNTRGLDVYTPPSYSENYLKVYTNVLIMQDGQNLFNASSSAFGVAWMCQDTVNELVVEGAMEEIIIVGPWNTGANRIWEYTYSYDNQTSIEAGGEGDLYLDFLTETLYPIIARDYRVPQDPTPDQLGILGSSLGGLISCYAGWTRSDVYGRAGCMSTSFWWNYQDFNNTIMKEYPVPKDELFYLDSGNAGPGNDDVTQTITVRDHMEADGFVINETIFYYLQNGGQHSEYYWGERFHVPMTYLYPPTPLTPDTTSTGLNRDEE